MITIYKDPLSEIESLHLEITESAKTTIEKAIRIGELLAEQKASLKHGEWLPWAKENLPFKAGQAQRYMRVYTRRDELNTSSKTHLTAACQILSAGDEEPEEQSFNEVDVIEPTRILHQPRGESIRSEPKDYAPTGGSLEEIEETAEEVESVGIDRSNEPRENINFDALRNDWNCAKQKEKKMFLKWFEEHEPKLLGWFIKTLKS
jgi:hypothetical protein